MKLKFFGGAKDVTGANYFLESGGHAILIDCGLKQGSNFAERQNFEPFPYDPRSISAVFVTHAHLDHVGRLPKLWREGFRGTIYSTPPTRDFAELVLLDSEHILSKEAIREGRENFCRTEDVERMMSVWKGVPYHEVVAAGPFRVSFFDAGHILGSAVIRVQAEGKTVLFSGDLGNSPAPIIKPTEDPPQADYCLIESTYGNRVHEESQEKKDLLEDVIEDTVKKGGTLIIPAFALERTQELLFALHTLFEERRVPKMPVFIDSPLAIKMTVVYKKHENYFNRELLNIIRSGDDILNFPSLRLTLTTEQSKEINNAPSPKIIIAGSGMSNGGRILHHEKRYLPDPKSTILFAGYQSPGTLGRAILDGAKHVRIFGEDVPVRAEKRVITGFSAHADQPRLLKWLRPLRGMLKKVFVVQGEEASSTELAVKIRDEYAVRAEVPEPLSEYVL